MPLEYYHLDQDIRSLMKNELELDIENNNIYLSPRLTPEGQSKYTDLLFTAFEDGDDFTLMQDIRKYLKQTETRQTKNGISQVKVPVTASVTLAEGEFNRYYIRALCRKVLESGGSLEVYRAKQVNNARSESQRKIGQLVEPNQLLEDLREDPRIDTVLGLPNGPNSGLSVKIA